MKGKKKADLQGIQAKIDQKKGERMRLWVVVSAVEEAAGRGSRETSGKRKRKPRWGFGPAMGKKSGNGEGSSSRSAGKRGLVVAGKVTEKNEVFTKSGDEQAENVRGVKFEGKKGLIRNHWGKKSPGSTSAARLPQSTWGRDGHKRKRARKGPKKEKVNRRGTNKKRKKEKAREINV